MDSTPPSSSQSRNLKLTRDIESSHCKASDYPIERIWYSQSKVNQPESILHFYSNTHLTIFADEILHCFLVKEADFSLMATE